MPIPSESWDPFIGSRKVRVGPQLALGMGVRRVRFTSREPAASGALGPRLRGEDRRCVRRSLRHAKRAASPTFGRGGPDCGRRAGAWCYRAATLLDIAITPAIEGVSDW